MTSIKSLCSTSAIALLALAVSPMATAQEEESRLDTVTVSAQRLEESLQDVPLSVSQVSGERLDVISSGGADIRFLSARVPSVIAESSFGRAFPRFYIRGIG
ncbi:MAG TPA: TonB-dependent receptor, partial [Hyphomonadaceae bacterium]|nr:TonB-dependent receptor [Hyphomonadaceae bacterium]